LKFFGKGSGENPFSKKVFLEKERCPGKNLLFGGELFEKKLPPYPLKNFGKRIF
jgi:hypothetical protein